MSDSFSRRHFIQGLGVAVAVSTLEARGQGKLYPPTDLSYFKKPIKAAPAQITWGYASITWGGKDEQAIREVAEAGYRGIQLRSNMVAEYGARTKELRETLAQNRLQMVALSSGGVRIDAGTEAEEIAKHTKHAAFVRDVGGLYLQVTDGVNRKTHSIQPDDYKRLGRVMTEIGKRTIDMGIPLGYHNHMNNLGERPDEVDMIMDAADPRYVKLELDVAHYQQGGGDPAQAIRRYRDRLLFLHIKDVESPVPGASGDVSRSYRFVELGRGKVNLPEVAKALKEINFRGWAVVELDSVPDKARTPKESALISKAFIEEKLGMKV